MFVLKIVGVLCCLYGLICLFVYWIQEQLIFHPEKLASTFVFNFEADFEEVYIEVEKGIQLHALHFKVPSSKGVVFYVHGNAGSLNDWGSLSDLYVAEGYDLFMFDYRGFGKSDGKISSEQQFFGDVQQLYNYIKTLYQESNIIVQGFSIGTATATKIALDNNPQQLILKAPYFTLGYLVKSRHFYLPMTLLKYSFRTVDYLKKLTIPVTIFHGTIDELIPIENAYKLKEAVPAITFVVVANCLHNDLPYTTIYKEKMHELLT